MVKLIDSFERAHTYLRISVTDRCNLRCMYCMPEEGIKWKQKEEILTYEEIFRIAKLLVSMGVNKIRITGGEPMVRNDIESLISSLSSIKGLNMLSMTTNALLLKDNAYKLKLCGLQSLNVSLDTLQKDKFIWITKRDKLNPVLEGINSALVCGFTPLKLNVVVIKGINDDEIMDFVSFVKNKPINVRFIEFMPFENNGWDYSKLVSYEKIKSVIQEQYELIPIKGNKSDVAKDFCIEGFQGTISFITSMTENFCSSCNRIRLTADGSFKTCLFHKPECNLRTLLRNGASDTKISEVILQALALKKIGHEPLEELARIENQSMIQIGG